MNDNTFKVYDLKEVCSILKISLQVLRRYIKKGEIKASKIGRKYVITEEALEEYIKGNTKATNIALNNEPKEALTDAEKQTLETLLASNKEVIDLNDYIKATGRKNLKEIELRKNLETLLNTIATIKTEEKEETFNLIDKLEITTDKETGKTTYKVALNDTLKQQFKENMLLNTNFIKK